MDNMTDAKVNKQGYRIARRSLKPHGKRDHRNNDIYDYDWIDTVTRYDLMMTLFEEQAETLGKANGDAIIIQRVQVIDAICKICDTPLPDMDAFKFVSVLDGVCRDCNEKQSESSGD